MKHPIEYKIIISTQTSRHLQELVRNLINKGWEPVGGMTITNNGEISPQNRFYAYYQTMIRTYTMKCIDWGESSD